MREKMLKNQAIKTKLETAERIHHAAIENKYYQFLIDKNHKDMAVDSLVIGAGASATAIAVQKKSTSHVLYEADPSTLYQSEKTLPGTLYLHDPEFPHQFARHQSIVLGQKANAQGTDAFGKTFIQTVSTYSPHRSDNPYTYPTGSLFSQALNDTQIQNKMIRIPLKVQSIELQEKAKGSWSKNFSQFPVRVTVKLPDQTTKTIYTHHVDLCTGLGHARTLNAKQIDPQLQKKLIQSGKIVPLSETGHDLLAHIQEDESVLIYGGSAMSAAVFNHLVKTSGKNVVLQWVSRDLTGYQKTASSNRVNHEIYQDKNLKKSMALGAIKKVELVQSGLHQGQLKVTLSNDASLGVIGISEAKKNDLKTYPQDVDIYVDRIGLGIGSQGIQLNQTLTDFEPIYLFENTLVVGKDKFLENTQRWVKDSPIPVGSRSKPLQNGKIGIHAWGAAAHVGNMLYSHRVLHKPEVRQKEKKQIDVYWHAPAKQYWKTMASESQGAAGGTLMHVLPLIAHAYPMVQNSMDQETKSVYQGNINYATAHELIEVLAKIQKYPKPFNDFQYNLLSTQANDILDVRKKSTLGIVTFKQLVGVIDSKIIVQLQEYYPKTEKAFIRNPQASTAGSNLYQPVYQRFNMKNATVLQPSDKGDFRNIDTGDSQKKLRAITQFKT